MKNTDPDSEPVTTITSQLPEVNSKMDKRGRISHTKYEVTSKERKNILINLGDSSLLLYQFYLRMAAIPDASMEDVAAAEYLFWSIRKVRSIRKRLEKSGYFRKIIYKASSGKKTITYYISQDSVGNS